MNSVRELNTETALHFGPYAFHLRQRLILDGDRPLRMGGRALDILQVLIERAGTVVSKEELIARVWPTSVVEDINLRVHIAALRRALGDGVQGQRYIVNVPQRGYRFVAPVAHAPAGSAQPAGTVDTGDRSRLVGGQPGAAIARLPAHDAGRSWRHR
jgi:DNA-binding winged helix-turn-helix (wHTH) protein